MKNSFRTLAALCGIAMTMTGCGGNSGSLSSSLGESAVTPLKNDDTTDIVIADSITPKSANEEDIDPVQTAGSTITFGVSGIEIKGSGAKVSGNAVTITSAGVYGISGECADGKIIIDAGKNDVVTLLLSGISLTSTDGSAINCDKAAKLVITAKDGTENTISDSESYTFEPGEDEPDAAVYCRSDMVINGSGKLTVIGLYKDGIKCKDGLKLCCENLYVTAAEDGIIGRDYIIAAKCGIKAESGGDGLKATNDEDGTLGYIRVMSGAVDITAHNDAVQAETELIVDGGSIKAVSGGGSETVEHSAGRDSFGGWGMFHDGVSGNDFDSLTSDDGTAAESAKGLKAGTIITVNGGEIEVSSADDSVHCNGNVLIAGGTLSLSTGDDGVHADGSLTVKGGNLTVSESYEGLEANAIEITDGEISVAAFDDGINASGDNRDSVYVSISGGNIMINAGGDGLDSNGSVAVSGGKTVVFGPTDNANGALDYESSFAVSGGELYAFGSSGMAQAPSTLSQPCLSIYADVRAGSRLSLRSASGEELFGCELPKACGSLIFTNSKLESGEEYSIYADDNLLTTVTAEDGVSGGGASGSGIRGFGHGGFGGGNFGNGENPDFGGEGMRPFGNDNGEAPYMPDNGEIPQAPDGERPSKPDRGIPSTAENSEAPSDSDISLVYGNEFAA